MSIGQRHRTIINSLSGGFMGKITYYATPRQIQELAIRKHLDNQPHISFPEGLLELELKGRLLIEKPPMPVFKENMTPEELDDFLLDIPFVANRFTKRAGDFEFDPTIPEIEIFPNDLDVFCFKHLPYMSEIPHMHDYFELTLVYKGNYKLLFENEVLNLTEGNLCIIPPHSPHNQPLDPSSLVIAICVRQSTFNSLFGNLLTQQDMISTFFRHSLYGNKQANYLRMKIELSQQITNLVQQLAFESNMSNLHANNCCVSLLNLFLVYCLRKYSDTIRLYNIDDYIDKDLGFVSILQYIQQNFQTVTLSSLAKKFHFNEAYLSRLIKKNLNQNFTSLLRELKMGKALEYLNNTRMKISDIADYLGYESVDHFTKTFKKAHGMPPTKYRKMNLSGRGSR